MFEPEELKALTNIVKLCCGFSGVAIVYFLLNLAIILEG